MSNTWVLKHVPEDFLVRESMVVSLGRRDESSHSLYLLRKRGYTTMEAVRLVADMFDTAVSDVSYGGLKDEDAITEQLVGLPLAVAGDQQNRLTVPALGDPARWLELAHYGYTDGPLRIGELEGNCFRVVVRNLERTTATILESTRKIDHFFLNYYDTQRFGVPGGAKRTHLVGEALILGRWDDALRELAGLNAPESQAARSWASEPRDYFLSIDPRAVEFYLSAVSSFRWNASLASMVASIPTGDPFSIEVDGLSYTYVRSSASITSLIAGVGSIPYARYAFSAGQINERLSARTAVVQAQINVTGVLDDDYFPGRMKAGLRFFLPSGSYATGAVRQLMKREWLDHAADPSEHQLRTATL